jgi:hypothetical protein
MGREVCLRAGAHSLAVVGSAAKLAAALVSLALINGQADACGAVPAQLQQHTVVVSSKAADIAENTSSSSSKHANRHMHKSEVTRCLLSAVHSEPPACL